MKTAIFAGSFDPITNGHIDILKRGAEIFDKIIIAVSCNADKKAFLPAETRVKLIKESVSGIKNVEVDYFAGLTVDYARKHNASVLLRGLRTVKDFEYEIQLSQTNSALDKNIETVFIIAKPEYSFVSSSAVREIFMNNGDISAFVPQPVASYLKKSIR